MRTISQILSNSNFKTTSKENSKERHESNIGGNQESKRIESDIVRVPREELMQQYVSDPLVFNSVNKYVQIIMAAGFHFEGSDESVKGAEEFFNKIGDYGGEIDEDILLAETYKNQFVIGSNWYENIYNKTRAKLVDLDIINPITIDYVRDNSGNVLLSDYGNPKGFVQNLRGIVDIEQKFQDEIPDEADISEKLFLPPWKVTHFKLYTIGDNLDGLGIVEPIYNSGNRKLNIEQGYANAARRLGYPIITAQIGDSLHEPTPQQKEDTLNEIADVDYKSSFAFPYYVKLGLLESKKPEKLSEHLDYFQNAQVTGLGLPQAFASGSGEATNRSTLARQEYIMKLSLKEVIKRTTKTINKNILSVLAKQNKWEDVPRMVWNEVSLEELDSKAKRIVSYAQAGLIKPTENIEKYIKHIEGLPE